MVKNIENGYSHNKYHVQNFKKKIEIHFQNTYLLIIYILIITMCIP